MAVPATSQLDANRMRIAILGGGPAGYAAASAAAAFGADATIVERERIGGACTVWDAIPSKTLLDAADSLHDIEHANEVGVELGGAEPTMDWGHTLQRVQAVTDHQCNGVASRLTQAGVRVVAGEGAVVDGGTLQVRRGSGETTIAFDALVVATGARPWVPEFVDVSHSRVLTTRTMWRLPALPESLLVVGSGATGCEMADFFQRSGSRVTLVSSRDRILPTEDRDVAWVVEDSFIARGMRIVHRVRAESVDADGDGVAVTLQRGTVERATHVLFAVGMQPNTDGIGLERVGVALGPRGAIAVDGYCCTSTPGIYAIGDVTGGVMLANVASMQGRHAVAHAVGAQIDPIRYEAVASTVFTRPEIADVGLSEQAAAEQQRDVIVVTQPLLNNPRAVINGSTEGLVKLVAAREDGTVLGGSIVGLRASEIITTIALAVRAGISVHELADTGAVSPAVSESLQRAAEKASAELGAPGRRVSSVTFS